MGDHINGEDILNRKTDRQDDPVSHINGLNGEPGTKGQLERSYDLRPETKFFPVQTPYDKDRPVTVSGPSSSYLGRSLMLRRQS